MQQVLHVQALVSVKVENVEHDLVHEKAHVGVD